MPRQNAEARMDGMSREVAPMPRNQSQQRIAQLVKQYPGLGEVLEFERGPRLTELTVHIDVQRGDCDLLYRVPICAKGYRDPARAGMFGSRIEYFRLVQTGGSLGRQQTDARSDGQPGFVIHSMSDLYDAMWYIDDTFDPIQTLDYIAWVSRTTWYPQESDLGPSSAKNQPVQVDVRITLFQAPERGWRHVYDTADPMKNVTLHGLGLIPGVDAVTNLTVRSLYDWFHRLTREFQQKVWATGLGTAVKFSPAAGMHGMFGTVRIDTRWMSSRVHTTLTRGDDVFHIAGTDELDNPRMRCVGVEGTAEQVTALVTEAIAFWENIGPEARRLLLQDNSG
jgi:hypothetical protein